MTDQLFNIGTDKNTSERLTNFSIINVTLQSKARAHLSVRLSPSLQLPLSMVLRFVSPVSWLPLSCNTHPSFCGRSGDTRVHQCQGGGDARWQKEGDWRRSRPSLGLGALPGPPLPGPLLTIAGAGEAREGPWPRTFMHGSPFTSWAWSFCKDLQISGFFSHFFSLH